MTKNSGENENNKSFAQSLMSTIYFYFRALFFCTFKAIAKSWSKKEYKKLKEA